MMRIENFNIEHFYSMELGFQPGQAEALGVPQFTDLLKSAEDHPAYAALIDDQVIACGGLLMLWPGVAEGWIIASSHVKDHPIAFHRAATRILVKIQLTYKLHRVQAIVHEDYTEGMRWLEMLGFVNEGTMYQYGPNKNNYIRFARIWK